jgi:hypothetical protein
MQCIFVVLLLFILSGFKIRNIMRPAATTDGDYTNVASEEQLARKIPNNDGKPPPTHRSIFNEFLEDFHKAQCYFSATIQVAALSYGIFTTDILITFLLIPLATNGVLPVVFTLFLLYTSHKKLRPNVILLTCICWLLSSLVYWTLYSHVIPINGDLRKPQQEFRAYLQFYYKLTSLEACGGYSALAACPGNFRLGHGDIIRASHKIRVLTPMIWSFSTLCLLGILGGQGEGGLEEKRREEGEEDHVGCGEE